MSALLRKVGRIAHRTITDPSRALTEMRMRLFAYRVLAKDPEAYQMVTSWSYGKAPRLPLPEIFPGIENLNVNVSRAFDRETGTSVTAHEVLVLGAIVAHLKPQRVLEIGTFNGNTTLNMAGNCSSDSQVTTLDLPPDWDGKLDIDIPESRVNVTDRAGVGRQFSDSPCANRIEQIYGDSATLDWSTLPGPFDLIFIDGNHEYEYVLHDTSNALDHIRSGGLIVWHDYGNFSGVSRVVDELPENIRVCVPMGTRLAIGFPDNVRGGA